MMKLFSSKRPARIIKIFSVIAVVSFVIVVLISYSSISYIYKQHIISQSQRQVLGFGQMLYQLEKDHLFKLGPQQNLVLATQNLQEVDQGMYQYLRRLSIAKLNLYAKDSKVIYSTDHKMIGYYDRNDLRLQHALRGKVLSKFVKKGEVLGFAQEPRLDVDVVGTYLPIFNSQNDIIGAFAIYRDITSYRADLTDIVFVSVFGVILIFLVIFGVLFVFFRYGMRRISLYQKELQELVVKDPLTGLLNRRALMSRGEEEFARAGRARSQLAKSGRFKSTLNCIMIDIDHFKKINDRFGHLFGDVVLQELARRIRRIVRRYDVVGRYGGEEFVVIMPHTSSRVVKSIATRLWTVVREKMFKGEGHSVLVTISLGVAALQVDDQSLAEVIDRADQAMYRAKQAGRDRVEFDHS